MSRLREQYTDDTMKMKGALDHCRQSLAEQQAETILLKDILRSRGIAFQTELESRKAIMAMQPRSGSITQSNNGSKSGSYSQPSPTIMSSSGRSPQSTKSQKYSNGTLSFASTLPVGGQSFHGHSPAEPGISERSVKNEFPPAFPKTSGVFERDQQLGIDFILA
jgi:hypothetical protein